MRILIHANHYPVCSARYCTDALETLGHDVRHVGRPMGAAVWGLHLPPEYVWTPDVVPEDWTPDLAILMDTAYQWHHPTAPTVVYTVDNHVRDVRQPGIARYFLAHRAVSETAWGSDCEYLPCAYDPDQFWPSSIPYAKRRYDVALLGFMYPRRWELVQALRAAGLSVIAGVGMVYDAYRALHHDARVAIVDSVHEDVPIRLFETMALGCAVLASHNDDLAALHPRGIRTYTHVDEAVLYAADMQTWDGPGTGAAEWVRGQTWQARMRRIVEWYNQTHTRT